MQTKKTWRQSRLQSLPRILVWCLTWRGKEIVNISRAFLDTNGAHQETTVEVEIPNKEGNLFEKRPDVTDVKAKWLETLDRP